MKNRLSFTITEFLIYIGLLSILLLVFAGLFTTLTKVRTESEATSNVQQDGNYLLNKFIYDVHQATSIVSPVHPGDQSNSLSLLISGVTYVYSTQSGNLNLFDGTNNYQLNSYETSVPSLLFTRSGQGDSQDIIKIDFTINSLVKNPSGNDSQSYETVVGLR